MPPRRPSDSEPLADVEPLQAPVSGSTSISRWEQLVAALLLIGAAIVPLYVSRDGDDHFRLPKELLLYAFVITSAAVAAVALLLGRIELPASFRKRARTLALLAAAGLTWAGISTLTSTNRALSIDALIWGASVVVLFFVAAFALRRIPLPFIAGAMFVPALANSTLLLLQSFDIWNPWIFPAGIYHRATKIAFLGNPDDVGVYLAAPALFALTLALTANRGRALYGVICAYITAALFATETLTAIGAYGVAVVVLLIVWNRRLLLVAAIAGPVVIAIVMMVGPTRDRALIIASAIRAGNWGTVVSGRFMPFAIGWEMFEDHPILGIGPGTYKYNYMDYFVSTRNEKPRFYSTSRSSAVNFGETHNDHLQMLAEMGLPGYATLAAAFVMLAMLSLRRKQENECRRIATMHAAPHVVLLATVMLAQFPLLLAAPAYTYTLLGALCLGWSDGDDAAA